MIRSQPWPRIHRLLWVHHLSPSASCARTDLIWDFDDFFGFRIGTVEFPFASKPVGRGGDCAARIPYLDDQHWPGMFRRAKVTMLLHASSYRLTMCHKQATVHNCQTTASLQQLRSLRSGQSEIPTSPPPAPAWPEHDEHDEMTKLSKSLWKKQTQKKTHLSCFGEHFRQCRTMLPLAMLHSARCVRVLGVSDFTVPRCSGCGHASCPWWDPDANRIALARLSWN